VVLRASAAVVGPAPYFGEFRHHGEQLFTKHFGHASNTWRGSDFLHCNHGLHDLDERRSISNATGEFMIAIHEETIDGNLQSRCPPMQIAEVQVSGREFLLLEVSDVDSGPTRNGPQR